MKIIHLKKTFFTALVIFLAGCFFVSCKKLSDDNVKALDASPGVVVSTIAGGGVGDPNTVTNVLYGQIGSANGLGTAASFYAPGGIAVDANGNLYVTEAGNYDVRKITADGTVSTIAGNTTGGFANGTGSSASFSAMQGIAIDASGNLYIADSGNNAIRKVTPTGVVTTFAGTGVAGSTNGPASLATFSVPTDVAIDAAGNMYVADIGNKMIRKITPDGMVSTLAGTGMTGYNNGAGATATFNNPHRIAVDLAGNIYVSDFSLVRKITPDGTVSTIAGHPAPDGGYADRADGTGTAAGFIVTDGIKVNASGNIYVGDSNEIRKITAGGVVTTLAGGGAGATTDGIASKASFGILRGMAINPSGNVIYVADYLTSLIRKVDMQ